jgi:tetratricopeptide (TPR) repeat protein
MTPQPAMSEDLRRATAAAEAGRFAEAEADCAAILAADSADAGALALSGALAARRGDLPVAISRYRAALAVAPGFVKALSNLGAALCGLQRFAEAEEPLTRALAEDPAHGPSLINLGQLRLRQNRAEEAIVLLGRAVAATPADAMAWNNLGAAYLRGERLAEAHEALAQAAALDPASAAAWSNLGAVAFRLGRHDDAVAALRAALAHGAPPAEATTHLGNALRGLGRDAEALAAHERALALKPELHEACFNRALLLLGQGRFAEGWNDYRARPSGREFRARCKLADTPRLAAEMGGQTVLLLTNLGFGDELFFLRFAPDLKRRGAKIVYRAGAKIAPLARQIAELDGVLGPDDDAPAADVTLLIDDLPYALGAPDSVAATPPPVSLHPDRERLERLRARLAAHGPPPYLGVTWRGGLDRHGSLFKQAPRDAVAKAVGAWPGTLLSLQRAPAAGETDAFAAEAGRAAHDLAALNDDLVDMLALLALLDDYVAVSNTNVHLRHSLGLPSRVMVPMPPDWRWMNEADESPWFPGSRVYRQAADGDWREALASLSRDVLSRQSRG